MNKKLIVEKYIKVAVRKALAEQEVKEKVKIYEESKKGTPLAFSIPLLRAAETPAFS